MNGPRNGPHSSKGGPDFKGDKAKRTHNYKLIVDPALNKGQKKLYRIDGVIPGDPTSNVIITDPRSRVARLLSKSKQADLIVPQFKVDEFYVGIPPPREVTFVNLNDNINSDFLRKMVNDLGRIDECSVCYNPQNGKHLGIAKIVFETTRSARSCVEKFDQTNKMGNTMTVFTDPLGKERQGYIDEKVYGIPRRQVDYQSEFVPRPEIYVEPAPTMPAHETGHTPHIPTDQPPPLPSMEHGEYHNDELGGVLPPHEYNESEQSHPNTTVYHPPHEPPGYHKHPSNIDYPNNGFRDYDHRTEPDGRRREGARDYRDHAIGDHSRDVYNNSNHINRGGQHWLSRGDHEDDRRRASDRELPYDRSKSYDRHRDSQRQRHNDNHRLRDNDDGRDARYGREHVAGRHGRESEHYRERDAPSSHHRPRERDGDQHPALEPPPPGADNHEHTLQDDNDKMDESDGEDEVTHTEELSTPTEEEPASDPGPLDLDSRIKMMLNQNKDLAGFGAPEPVTAAPTEHIPPPIIMPLEPQMNYPPPIDPTFNSNGFTPQIMPHMTPYGHQMNVPPPQVGINHSHHVNMAPPVPPGWQPQMPYGTVPYPQQDGYPPMHDEYGEYPDQQHYEDEQFEEEAEMEEQIDYADAFDTALEDLIDDLKNIMNKDLCKRIVTQSAFKFFENWWHKEEDKTKSFKFSKFIEESLSQDGSRHSTRTDSNSASTSADADNTSSSTPALTSFSSLFDGSSVFGSGSFLGLGAGLPKMPSFRKKISPTRELELKREREEQERLKNRAEEEDDEEEEGEIRSGSKSMLVKRPRGSVSSGEQSDESSSSSSSSSESESEEESSDSSDSDSEKQRKSKKAVVSSSENESSSEDSSSESESESELEESQSEAEEEKPAATPAKRKAPVKKQAPSKPLKTLLSESSAEEPEHETESSANAKVLPESPVTPESSAKAESSSVKVDSPVKLVSSEKAGEPEPMEELSPVAATADRETDDVDVDLVSVKLEEPASDLYVMVEHNYCKSPHDAPLPTKRKYNKTKATQKSKKQLQDITDKVSAKGNRELDRLLKDIPAEKPRKPDVVEPSEVKDTEHGFKLRDAKEEMGILYDIFTNGVDAEDLKFFKMCYDKMLSTNSVNYDWCNDTHWVDHSITSIPDPAPPPAKRSRKSSLYDSESNTNPHKTGSARTEGYYKISSYEKSKYMTNARQFAQIGKDVPKAISDPKVSAQNIQREARSNQRRLATAFGDLDTGELLKFNQLKFRNKALRFCKSTIHDWGLYACEPIPADTMVIEYVGAILRHSVADEREKQYERTGIGSSYLFRIDGETVIDATKCGNLARFVNHSCDPNCYARVITVDGAKKIVIYSRRKIGMDEEITYDYKFPYEDEKIPCLCGMAACRGFLN